MPWFYAEDGKQMGPVEDAEFDRLMALGTITGATLVWRQGMANWEPLAKVRPALPPPPIAVTAPAPLAPGLVRCTECQNTFPAEETIEIGAARVCAACKPIYVQKLREGRATFTPAPTVGTMRYAGFWIRVVAKIIDGLIVGIPVMLIYLVSAFVFGFSAAIAPGGQPDFGALMGSMVIQLLAQGVGLVLGGIYNVFFVVKYGATPGKMAVNLRIITPDGRRLSVGRAIGRYFAEMVSGMACYIGYILVAFDDQKRALHDRMCETRVVYK